MSSEALAWAFRQECKSSSVKFTLVALCECANYRTGRITPSIEHLSEITGQNRKTIIANVAALEAQGLIADTGERVGRTKQIKVYQTTTETVPKAEQSQERNSSGIGGKESQKRDTEPSLEPSSPTVATQPSEKRARASKAFHPLPENWQPVLTPTAVKAVAGWPPGHFDTVLAAFLDHAADKGRLSKDWQAAFRTWLTNENKWNRPNGQSPRQADLRQTAGARGERPNRCLDMLYAAEAEIRAAEHPEPDLETGLALRAIQ